MFYVQEQDPTRGMQQALMQGLYTGTDRKDRLAEIARQKAMQDELYSRQLEEQRKNTELQLLLGGYTKGGPSASPYAPGLQSAAAHNASQYTGQSLPPEAQKPAQGSFVNPVDNYTYAPPPDPEIPDALKDHYTYMRTGPGKGQVLNIPQPKEPSYFSAPLGNNVWRDGQLVQQGVREPKGDAESRWTLNYIDANGKARSKKGRGDALYESAERSIIESGGQVLVPGYNPPKATEAIDTANKYMQNINTAAEKRAEISTYKTTGDPLSEDGDKQLASFVALIGKDPNRRYDKDILDQYDKYLQKTIAINQNAYDKLGLSTDEEDTATAPPDPEFEVTYDENTGGATGRIKQPGQKKQPGQTKPASSNYGARVDGTPKGTGWYGPIKTPGGKDMTELSIGVEIDGKEVEIPALAPGLTKDQIEYLRKGGEVTPEIVDNAVRFAKKRMAEGKSPFKESAPQSQSSPLLPDYNFSEPAESFGAWAHGRAQGFDRNEPLYIPPRKKKPVEKFPGYNKLKPSSRDFWDRNNL